MKPCSCIVCAQFTAEDLTCNCEICHQYDVQALIHSNNRYREALERNEELEGLLLDMGGYIGSDIFIRASNAHDMNVKCAQLTTELAASEQALRDAQGALEQANLALIEARNPGIDMEAVKRQRSAALAPDAEAQTWIASAALGLDGEG